jgi:hypothetical protein
MRINAMKSIETNKLRLYVKQHGLERKLESVAAIARYLGYDEHCFRAKLDKSTFRLPELKKIFRELKFKQEEIIEVMT